MTILIFYVAQGVLIIVHFILDQNNFPSLLFFDDVFTGVRAGLTVTHMRSTNSKPQSSNDSH